MDPDYWGPLAASLFDENFLKKKPLSWSPAHWLFCILVPASGIKVQPGKLKYQGPLLQT